MRGAGLGALAAALSVLGTATAARAADEEIRVYQDEMSRKGQFGLDVHINYVAVNHAALDYAGQEPSAYRTRITPEFAYGLTPHIELGAYLPLADIQGGGLHVGGAKLRIKYIATKPEAEGWFWGGNFELGQVNHAYDINPWNAEAKGIVGWRSGPWTVGFNTNIDWAVSGPERGPATVQFATKVSYKLNPALSVGMESYDGAGDFDHFGRFAGSGHSLYAVADASLGKWDLDIGVGRGYSGEADQWTFKMIVGVPIDD